MAAVVGEGRLAIYAETGYDCMVLRTFAVERGWTCHRTYRPSEWREMLNDAEAHQFEYIVAAFDGRWWFSPTDPNRDPNPVLPRLRRPRVPKGGISGTADEVVRLLRTALEDGPKPARVLSDLLVAAGLAWGTHQSIMIAVSAALRRTGVGDFKHGECTPWEIDGDDDA